MAAQEQLIRLKLIHIILKETILTDVLYKQAYIHKKMSNYLIVKKSNKWKPLLNKVKLYANKKHSFNNKTMQKNKVNFIKINIYPDGGISRIRAFGKIIK